MFALQQCGFPTVGDFPLLQHLAHDHFNMLIVDLHTLQSIHILHLIDHIVGQRLDSHDCKNIMRCRVAINDIIALLNKVAFADRNMFALGDHIFNRLNALVRRLDTNAPLVFVILTKAHIAINFRNDSVIFWTPCLEQFCHPWQTTGDVFGLGTLTRDPRDHITRLDALAVVAGQNRINRHRIGQRIARIVAQRVTRLVKQDDLWLQFIAFRRSTPVDNNFLGHTSGIVGLFAHSDPIYQIHMFCHA